MADPYDPVAEKALFAQRFSGTTNLEQRRRFAQDITRARAEEDERRAMEFEQQQRADPRLMQAVTARRRENRMLQEGFERGDLARQRLEFDIGRDERANRIAQKKLQLDMGREDRLMRAQELELQRAEQKEEDELGFDEDERVLREQVTPGSSAYQRGIFDILMKRKHLDRDFRNNVLKAAGVLDPEEAWRQAADAQDAGANRVTVKTPGGVTATFTNEKRDLSKVQNELSAARRMFARETEPSNKTYAESLVRRLEQEAQGLGGTIGPQPEGQSQAPQAPAASANNFTDQESYMKARAAAPSGTILYFNGKPYRKQ